ncbi:MAG TPA: RDD family protein, partial [Anaerolineae bacterium]|nr:RDD family protein [Anaerolineae bacterium]
YGNSEQRRGQTVGKRLLGVAVVDKNYEYLSWPRATARAVVLSLILMLNGWAVVESAFWLVATMINMVVFISILLLLYGFIFNRTTRQGAHDLLLGTYVIRVQPEQEVVSLPDLPVLHKRFMYGIVGVVIFAYLGCAGLTLMGTEEVGGTVNVVPTSIAELQDAILAEFDINYLHIESRTIWSNGGGTNILIITGWVTMSCDRYRGDCQRLLDDIEELVAAEYDEVEQYDRLQVRVVNGFDFGLVSGSSYVGSDGAMVRIGG